MHIHDYVLPLQTVAGVSALSGVGLWLSRRHLTVERIPQAGVLASAFFVATLIHVPLGVTSAHLVLNGLLGMMLGWAAFPAVFVALLMQAVMFGHGGLTVLGVNTFAMAAPAVAAWYAFGRGIRRGSGGRSVFLRGFAGGALAVLGAALLQSLALLTAGEQYGVLAATLFSVHLPVALVEGFITAHALAFLHAVRPEALQAAPALARGLEGVDA